MTNKIARLNKKTKFDLEHFLIKNEPGFPGDLKYMVRSSYARGVIAQAMMGHFGSKSDNLMLLGYEGLDVEMWCQIENQTFLISSKRLGYKDLNTKFGHEIVDKIRNDYLKSIDTHFKTIRSIILRNLISPDHLVECLKAKIDGLTSSESRVLMSRVNTKQAKNFRQAKRLIDNHRRQVESLSKFNQLLALVKYNDSDNLKTYSMRSMVQVVEDKPLVKNRIADFIKSLGDIGFNYYSSEFAKIRKIVATFLASDDGSEILLKILLEFYHRPVLELPFDLPENVIDSKLLNKLLTAQDKFMTNDFLIIYELSQVIKKKEKFLMLHADREGILRLNSKLGTAKVDRGLRKQGNIILKTVEKINIVKKVQAVFCQRNVDEVLILITGNLEENYKVIRRTLRGCFEMIDKLKEFMIIEGKKTLYHSRLPGRLLYLDGNEFVNPQEVVLFADKESQRHKQDKNRRFTLVYDKDLKITKHRSKSDLSSGQDAYEVFSSPVMNLISQLLS